MGNRGPLPASVPFEQLAGQLNSIDELKTPCTCEYPYEANWSGHHPHCGLEPEEEDAS